MFESCKNATTSAQANFQFGSSLVENGTITLKKQAFFEGTFFFLNSREHEQQKNKNKILWWNTLYPFYSESENSFVNNDFAQLGWRSIPCH